MNEPLTVKRLREILANWPDTYEDGTPTTVWIETGENLSSVATTCVALDRRNDRADLLLTSDFDEEDSQGS